MAQFNRPRSRHGPKKAICAVAASMLTAVYHMLGDGTEHQDLGADHFDLPLDRGQGCWRSLAAALQPLAAA